MSNETPENFDRDVQRLTSILRNGGYSYRQSMRLIKKARENVGLKPPKRNNSSPERLTQSQKEDFIDAAYDRSGKTGLMMRTLLETGARVGAFVKIRIEDIAFPEREVRLRKTKGGKARDVPILASLAQELKIHVGDRESGWLFVSPQGGHYSKRRIQQIVKETAKEAGIQKSVSPHLLRKTIAQHLADQGMPENLLQQFLGHEHPETTQIYYTPKRSQVDESYRQAMKED